MSQPTRFNAQALITLSPSQQRLFERYGRGVEATPAFDCIHHAFEAQAALNPEALAARHGEQHISYGELDSRAESLARQLADRGIGRGAVVGLFLQRSIAMLVGLLAVLKRGAAYAPQDIGITPPLQLAGIVEAAGIDLILTQSAFSHLLPGSTQYLAIDPVAGHPSPSQPVIKPKVETDDSCFVLFTSGTTGTPNGVRVSHRNICNILLTEPGSLGIGPGDCVGQILNIAFDMAAWEILGCLSHGATLLIRDKNIQATAHQCTVLVSTPSILATLSAPDCTRLRTVALAGEPCPQPLAERWARTCALYIGCGPTETTIVNTLSRYPGEGPLSIGRPTPNNTVYLLDENVKPCEIGQAGEMWAGGVGVSQGYLNNSTLNLERYRCDPFLGGDNRMFRTRDIARWTHSGELEYLGRSDDQVKVRGFRVELVAVGAVLERFPGCTQAVALKVNERELIAFASPGNLDRQLLLQHCRQHLPYYAVPAQLILLDALPLTSRGKIDKQALRLSHQPWPAVSP